MTQESQYEYRERKEKERRLAEATAGGKGYVVLKGGVPNFPAKEAWRAAPGAPIQIAGEVTPAAANPGTPPEVQSTAPLVDAESYYRKI